LAAEGQIGAALVYAPDRLSRKYAYQVLLAEELSRCGVELVFLKSPAGSSPEDQLLVQFQGMIAEYERAQIAERCRRGKRHKAQQGLVNVLSGAPYGYRYVRKSDSSAAYYAVVEAEATVVRMVFETYTQQGLSINAIARLLNERQIPTRTATTRWERSTVWAMLRNPAYVGKACYGKTELRPRQRITRPLRRRKGLPSRNSANHERPRQDWIEVPVPSLVRDETFALAQEQLQNNKHHSPRRTMEPTLLQGMLVCRQCGYALYRTSTRTSKQKLNYYRCIGSDGYRRLQGPVCTNRPVRQDGLDRFVWNEIIALLEDPALIQAEIDRRREVARNTNPVRKREEQLRREQARLERSIERLIGAYQEDLMTLAQLRQRMPELRKQAQAIESELQSLEMAAVEDANYLQLAETLTAFRTRLRGRADTLDVRERQQILRLLVKEIIIGSHTITIRHSLPVSPSGSGPDQETSPPNFGAVGPRPQPGYLLRLGSPVSAAGEHLPGPTRSGTGEARAQVLPLRRRLQYLCGQRGGGADAGVDRGLDRETSAAEGEPRQERQGQGAGTQVSGLSPESPGTDRGSAGSDPTIQNERAADVAKLSEQDQRAVAGRLAALRARLVGLLPLGRRTKAHLPAGGMDQATHPEMLLAALARRAGTGTGLAAAGSASPAAAHGAYESRGVVHGGHLDRARGVEDRHAAALWLLDAIGSCGPRLRPPRSIAGCGKPHVRWCGRVPGRNPRHPTRSNTQTETLPAIRPRPVFRTIGDSSSSQEGRPTRAFLLERRDPASSPRKISNETEHSCLAR
jgi:site-specific DNA recombinase